MASPTCITGGWADIAFLDPPAKLKEFECPCCLQVTRDPNLTTCCGQHFCQSCINRVLTDRKPCPLCKEVSFTVVLDKKQRRRVFELRVRCAMTERGCDWMGELGQLDAHMDVLKGKCQFVDVSCPNNCGESCQKRHLDSHVSDTCQKRPFSCMYCAFESTYEMVCSHYNKCSKFPLSCPNKCEIESVERGKMDEHLRQCPLQLVECEYAQVGCNEQVHRKDLASHMEHNVQKHLLWAFAASQKQISALEQQIEEKDEALRRDNQQWMVELEKRQTEAMRQQAFELERSFKKQLFERDQQIGRLRDKVAALDKHLRLPPVVFTVGNYSDSRNSRAEVKGPVIYTHPSGAKLHVCTKFTSGSQSASPLMSRRRFKRPAMAKSPVYSEWCGNTFVSVELHQLPGEFDEEIKWPLHCIVTVYLLNQLANEHHIIGSMALPLTRKVTMARVSSILSAECDTIEEHSKKDDVQYVKDNSLIFRIRVEIDS